MSTRNERAVGLAEELGLADVPASVRAIESALAEEASLALEEAARTIEGFEILHRMDGRDGQVYDMAARTCRHGMSAAVRALRGDR